MTTQKYIEILNQGYKLGNSTEHTFRGYLQMLIQEIVPNVVATNEPKRQKCGAPDYIITKKNKQIPIGFIEAKDIGVDLDDKKHKEQFTRYKTSLDNLIITDYLTFRLYENSELKHEVQIGKISEGKIIPIEKNFSDFESMMKTFCEYQGLTIKSAKKLATMMADKAKMLQHVIENAINSDVESEENTTLKEQMLAFKELLIHDIGAKEFSDLYAQTIAYGMFAARLEDPTLPTFDRQEAATLIPKSNPFLRNLFQYIAGPELDERIIWIVDDLADTFRATDIKELLKNFGRTTHMNDPIIHFYEDFLIEYDPDLRKSRGVWYTPAPVVNFIVKSVDEILRKDFNMELGIADYSMTKIKVKEQGIKNERSVHKTQILDPATGTGTFLSEVFLFIYEKYFKNQQGSWNNYVDEHLIPRVHGFELLMTSYAMAHLKLELLLRETKYESTKSKRLGIYLTNSLEEHQKEVGTLFGAKWLSQEANEASFIKRDTPVMCIIGNPPYSGESFNKGEWIMKLMEKYKMEPGGKVKLDERNSKWLNDDYVKFICYAQNYIEKNNEGILAYINPHGFLDNPTFRGMRWNLLKSFDKIYVIDLHGNSKKKEISPDGSPDQNVFEIQQGVSINIFVKTGKKKSNLLAEVFHFDIFGKRDFKFDFLLNNSLETIPFTKIENVAPDYFFVPKDFGEKRIYDKGFSVNELFFKNSVGVVTARDNFTIHQTKDEVQSTIETFLKLSDEEARKEFNLGKDVRDWTVAFARKDLENNYLKDGKFLKINYRPFDTRWTFYTGKSKGFHCYPRDEVMKNFIQDKNLALVIGRQGQAVGNMEWNLSFISKNIGDLNIFYRGGGVFYPLYLYEKNSDSQDKFAFMSGAERTPNLKKEIVDEIAEKIKLTFTNEKEGGETFAPIDILDYIYGVLHSTAYREKFKEFLKIDFPKVPYPKNREEFENFSNVGGKLRELHLMENISPEKINIAFNISGNNLIEKISFEDNKVFINSTQYFENVSKTAWEFFIGGYQPAQKYLKDRKGSSLGFEEINHYRKICWVLEETSRLMGILSEKNKGGV